MKNIRNYIENFAPINDEDWANFSSKLQRREFSKKTKFLKFGEQEDCVSFIENGIVRLLVPNEDEEKEITFGFCFENEFLSAYDSFLTRTPSLYELEAIASTTIWSISHSELEQVYQQTKTGNMIGRVFAERLFLIKSKREQSLLTDTAEERYLKLFVERPNLIKEIPLKYIASYIGVTPQALSRIRARIT